MRAAVLLSVVAIMCGIAAAFGYPAVWVNGAPVVGLRGLMASIPIAAVFPLAVLAWRTLSHTRRPDTERGHK
jgi:hypothetical protein